MKILRPFNSSILIAFLICCQISTIKVNAQNCPSPNSWEWPSHSNWYFGSGVIADFKSGGLAVQQTFGPSHTSYEGVSIISDDNGNLLYFTEGIQLWDAAGNDINTGNRLTEGSEGAGYTGSAAQGLIIVKHPLMPTEYHIFCLDDVIGGAHGLHHFILDATTGTLTGPTTLFGGKTTEGIAATKHANGVDLWITAQPENNTRYYTFKLTCAGLEPAVTSNVGHSLSGNRSRGSFEFSGDGTMFAQCHPDYYPNGATEVTLYDFDNATGIISNTKNISPTATVEGIYDLEFSPDNTKLFTANGLGDITFYDVTAGSAAAIEASLTTVGKIPGEHTTIELGGDGLIYANSRTQDRLYKIDPITNTLSQTNITGLSDMIGLPNMYLPPTEDPEIQPVGPFCLSDPAVDLETVWECSRINAEDPNGNPASFYSGVGITDAGIGIFNPNSAGVGIHEIIFTKCDVHDTIYIEVTNAVKAVIDPIADLCDTDDSEVLTATPSGGQFTINGVVATDFDPLVLGVGVHKVIYTVPGSGCSIPDTIDVTVNSCGCLDTTLIGVQPICVGESIDLSTMVVTSEPGDWTLETSPGGQSALIAGNIFDASNAATASGNYVLRYTLNPLPVSPTCPTFAERTIVVNPIPVVTIDPFGPLCSDSVITTMSANPTGGIWSINGNLATDQFDPNTIGAGMHEVIYGYQDAQTTCVNADTISIEVIERATVGISVAGPFCADDPIYSLMVNPNTGIWSGTGVNALGDFNPANAGAGVHTVYNTISGRCGTIDSMEITVNAVQDATINSVADTLYACILDGTMDLGTVTTGGVWNNNNVTINGAVVTADLTAIGITENLLLEYSMADPCGDKDTIWLTVTDQLDASINQPQVFCDNDSPYQLSALNPGLGVWSGIGVDPITGIFDPSTANIGLNTITYTIPGNCGDISSIDVEVLETPDPNILTPDQSVCEDGNSILLESSEVGGVWTSLDTDNGALNSTTLLFVPNVSGSGVFEYEYSFGGQCPASDTMTITVIAVPNVNIEPQDTLCDIGEPVQLIFSPMGGIWTPSSVVNVNGIFDPTKANWGSNEVIYTVDNQGCVDADTISVLVLKSADAAITPADTMCVSDDVVKILNSGDGGGVWSSSVAGAIDPVFGLFDPGLAGVGRHTITYSISGKCGDEQSIIVTVVGPEDPTISIVNPVCEGSELITFNTATLGGGWTGDVSKSGTFDPVTPGSYMGIYSIYGRCISRDTVYFEVMPKPTTKLTNTDGGCVPSLITFIDESSAVALSSNWDFGNETSSTDLISTSNTYSLGGCYDVTLTNTYEYGCVGSDQVNVCVFDVPLADFDWNPNPATVENNLVSFTNLSQDATIYGWDFTDITDHDIVVNATTATPELSSEIHPVVLFNSEAGADINACLMAVNDAGCKDSICKVVVLNDLLTVFIPNAFSPNGDGVNDVFNPLGRNLDVSDDYEFIVFNRWGEVIYQTDNPTAGWNGRKYNNMQDAQIDVYVWKLSFIDPFTGDKFKRIGHVSLIR